MLLNRRFDLKFFNIGLLLFVIIITSGGSRGGSLGSIEPEGPATTLKSVPNFPWTSTDFHSGYYWKYFWILMYFPDIFGFQP